MHYKSSFLANAKLKCHPFSTMQALELELTTRMAKILTEKQLMDMKKPEGPRQNNEKYGQTASYTCSSGL